MMGPSRALLLVIAIACCLSSSAMNVTYDGRAIIIDGQRRVLISGSIHYARSTAEMWPDLIQKAKEGGVDAIDTYIFWNAHEPSRGEYNFEGNLNFIKFIKIVQDAGLYVVLRIGPYVCAEWNYGGFPVWLHQIPGIELRTNNDIFKAEMQTFTTLIVSMIKKEKLLAPEGGPVIITQINTCNGFYCHKFKPNRPSIPKMWTENWTGWFKGWGESQPHRPVEDVAYAVANFFASGGTFQNYYMYHGGTNFGRTSGGPYLTTSYDYDAPLDEYGNIRQPKWGHLKQLHSAIKMMEKILTYGEVNTTQLGNALAVTKFSINETSSGCFLTNANQSNDANATYNGNTYLVPSRSISILPDCKKEVYNTAKCDTQQIQYILAQEDEPTG